MVSYNVRSSFYLPVYFIMNSDDIQLYNVYAPRLLHSGYLQCRKVHLSLGNLYFDKDSTALAIVV